MSPDVLHPFYPLILIPKKNPTNPIQIPNSSYIYPNNLFR
jgi:hypothetical protein